MTETATTMAQPGNGERFINYLKELADDEDRAALAALRRSLGKTPGEAAEAHRHVLRFNPDPWDEWAYYLVAGLFALHPESWAHKEVDRQSTNFGASFAWLKSKTDSDSIEKRLVALLDCHEDDLAEHLRHAVSLLRSKEIPVDWAQLLRDLRSWNHEDRFVQRRWARAFWGGNQTDQQADEAPS
ncbi:MAG: CRISPR-associated protein Cse2 [Gammaproteobacteria bacterium]|nr:CRISPR-associated protein Cse2 [Gammaproteobacteria bacterium]